MGNLNGITYRIDASLVMVDIGSFIVHWQTI
jgi:hypothetical protein